MNRNLVLVSALGAGLMTAAGVAQTAGPQAPTTPQPAPATQPAPAPVKPEAIPAKIALIAFEQAVFATNEGQKAVQDVQKNGYTMLLDNTGQQGGVGVLWTQAGVDISQAVVDAYNASSGVAAPVPSAPSAARPRTTAPKPATSAPPAKPATPKQ